MLATALKIPELVWTAEGDCVNAVEALCILLRRLCYPNRWIELRKFFGRSQGSMSRIFYAVLSILDRLWSKHLSRLDHPWLSEEDLAGYASAISQKGGVFPDVFAFIDGTARPICRPTYNQKIMYSGHKRLHCTKWQSILLPNGLICNLHGGEPGSVHDSRMFQESKMLGRLKTMQSTFCRKFALYGDSGYGMNDYLRKPYSKLQTAYNRVKRHQNHAMKTVRESVEWGFKEVVVKFAFVDFRKQMKLFEKPVNKIFRMAVFLTNCCNCLYPNQASQYFNVEPPTLEEYLC
ncbi:uncharacterized protein LOC129589089 [Paramacrobiotus metropolitanus]|uniref:uncharacterized protein LOC129589089 n=1 Tax=Paramacrobiotus metropolitanus TaxID=2943436 RepID=UPI0024462605|nr:uncharacterized protein LOC129589089 [Paramacrobiotus metropolitanus]